LSAKIIPIGKTVQSASDVGRTIRTARRAQGLTQAELARRCRVGQRFISELENGKPTVQLELTLRVLAALGISLGILERY
jgi:HTH-type transcriptional regulator / antitoxin HipB